PGGLWGDGAYLYVTDRQTIRKVNIATGDVTTLAGVDGLGGAADGLGSAARFSLPTGLWGDGTNLYVTDGAGTIRKIVIATRIVTTLAGTPFLPPFQFDNAAGTGSAARSGSPSGIWGDGTFLYVTDLLFHSVRRVRIANG